MDGNNKATTSTYNADGIRTSKTVNGVTTEYTLDGSNVVVETNGTDTIWYYYDASGSLTGFELNRTAYFYVKNMQGDIVAVTDSSGTKVVEYLYDSWGKLVSTTGSLASTVGAKNPYRYRGYRYDTETGLYYLQSRYYDPVVKRFINADSVIAGVGGSIQGYNMFAYCFNSPVISRDPSGNWPKWLEELGSRLSHAVDIFSRIIISPLKAITAEVGIGIGIGGKAKLSVNKIPVEVSGVASIKDSITYDKGKLDAINSTSINCGINLADVFDFSKSNGYEHSYFDDNCTCNFWNSSYYHKSKCATNRPTNSIEASIGFSIGLYPLFGGEVSIGIDFDAWGDELVIIFNDSLSYSQNK